MREVAVGNKQKRLAMKVSRFVLDIFLSDFGLKPYADVFISRRIKIGEIPEHGSVGQNS